MKSLRNDPVIKRRKESGKCHAHIYHGPGHQSRAFCDRKGKHSIHHAIYGCYDEEATWKRKIVVYSGFFNEPPTVSE